MRLGRHAGVGVALVAVAAQLLGACASADRPSVQGDTVALPTPLQSFGASLAATMAELQAAVTTVGSRLVMPAAAYRPSEPESLLQIPRVVMRADLADPGDGYLIIYQAPDAAQAELRAQELASYLGSGFGQTNYPVDAQFSVAVEDDAVIFTSWSPGRSTDGAAAEAVFRALATVGEAIEVIR
jgi:hypothetical protein